MSLSSLPLSYCTNVHPARTAADVVAGLSTYTLPVQQNYGRPLAAGLWLASSVVKDVLATSEGVARLRDELVSRGLTCHTLNAFPYGDFHSPRVKENVYIPDWSDPRRLAYTRDCARILAGLLPDGGEGSISTVPLGFKQFSFPADHQARCIGQLLELAQNLDQLAQETGRLIRLAIEPEPLCLLETTPETIAFFVQLFEQAAEQGLLELARKYLGVCYDVCHQAVEFEDVPASIRALRQHDIRINKIHITVALQLDDPARNLEGRHALANYVEERYLHQTLARIATGNVLRQVDLTEELALHPPAEFLEAPAWRIHFHVPVNAERLGPLSTTRPELELALQTVAQLDYAPHLEVETYTWQVLPGTPRDASPARLIDGLTLELTSTQSLLDRLHS